MRKDVFPYEWHQDLAHMEERQLPPRVALHSHLPGAEVSSAGEYKFAGRVCRVLGCRTVV